MSGKKKKSKLLAEEQEEESTNWLEANCGDLHEERKKFIVFESKLKELFSSSVCYPNCGRKVNNMTLMTKGCVATIENFGCCQKPMRWQTQPFVSSTGRGKFTAQCQNLVQSQEMITVTLPVSQKQLICVFLVKETITTRGKSTCSLPSSKKLSNIKQKF